MDKAKIKNIAIIVVSSLALFFVYNFAKRLLRTDSVYVAKKGGSCPGEVLSLTQKDPYMRGILNDGASFKVVTNFYDCNPLKRNDIVYYQLNKAMDPVVKIVRGLPGDNFRILRDEKKKNWNIEIEGDLIYSEQDSKLPFFFGGQIAPPLALYQKSNKGKIQPGDALLLSSWPPGDLDSAMFGMFSLAGIIGKVQIEGRVETPVEEKPAVENAAEKTVAAPTPATKVQAAAIAAPAKPSEVKPATTQAPATKKPVAPVKPAIKTPVKPAAKKPTAKVQ